MHSAGPAGIPRPSQCSGAEIAAHIGLGVQTPPHRSQTPPPQTSGQGTGGQGTGGEDLRAHVNLPDQSKQGNATKLNCSFSNEKRAAQVGFEPTTYCLPGSHSTNCASETAQLAGPNQGNTRASSVPPLKNLCPPSNDGKSPQAMMRYQISRGYNIS